MTARQLCEAAEEGLARAGKLLLSPSPATLEDTLQALARAAELMEALAASGSRDWDSSIRVSLFRLQNAAHELALRLAHSSLMVRGWMQVHLGEGYTRQGAPRFAELETGRQLEA